ncbi:hypothetical protein LTR47_005433 [Exophiala xenobiotica]|nr:hypothetical protein LTR47_005433 [Exophiala xenobiotica]KAK5246561.1 hypothetical protein LTS06_008137 [Exophiala xenobiotica]KAK5261638.1 hypothetical protein LTR40_001801 [Exophiala xenobiotica]KAK5314784.1 hypothetical protein LTR93_010167 [Exophiala xenobiotica]KAK5345567.1 hypothetical protein LTR61_010690 [Exophiala xenobiotica]
MAPSTKQVPSFEQLPLRAGDPPYSAWGFWENPGLGALNYLSDDNTLQAIKKEVKTGIRIGLNLPLDLIDPPLLGRRGFERHIVNKAPRVINDDVITFNTQGSSQWDSFRHFAYQQEGKFYNNVSQDDIHGEQQSTVNGMDAVAPRGIAGRGVLIDHHSWAQRNGMEYDRLGGHAITLDSVEKIIKECNIELCQGDIFIIRTGFVAAYTKLDPASKTKYSSNHAFPGLGQSKEVAKWLWEHQFAAVAGDNPAFECIHPDFGMLHPILLSGWGTTIGELFDLDALAKECERQQRWTFFLASSPLNYTGVVASPPNIMAIL